MGDLTNILNSNEELNEEQLMQYLKGRASESELHAIESSINNSEFNSDAVEGLQELTTGAKLEDYVLQLNKSLNEQLGLRKRQKNKRKIKYLLWSVVAVLIIVLLCLAGFWVIKMF